MIAKYAVGKICSAAVRLTGMFFRQAASVHEARNARRRRAFSAITPQRTQRSIWLGTRIAKLFSGRGNHAGGCSPAPQAKASACNKDPSFVNYNKEQK
jgi:hypothetical protein